MQYFSLLLTAAEGQAQNSTLGMIFSFAPLVLIFVVMYFLMIRPQKKKEKQAQEMRNNIQIGDEITTIGGIVGIVVRKGEDTLVLETGGDKSKIRIKTWAVQSSETLHDAVENKD